MKSVTKYLYHIGIIIFLLGINIGITFSEGTNNCETQEGYNLYTCRIQNICEVYKPQKPIYKKEKYKDAEALAGAYLGDQTSAPALGEAKRIYRENMGNTYKCVMVQSQTNALKFLKEQLSAENTGRIDDIIGRQIEQRLTRLEITASTLKCSMTERDNFTVKLDLLNETTYELCHYISYLEYLKVYYSDTNNIFGVNEEGMNTLYQQRYDVTHIPEVIGDIHGEILAEIEHTYKVFPLVYHAYGEYENNFPIHFMLEIIHADFVLLKQKMYETIMPIAQVGYKIINAMSY